MILSRAWTYFEAVARHGSLKSASEELNVASSAIGAQISQLEHDLGAPLFDRLPRGMRLSSAGETFLHHGRRAILEIERGRAFVERLHGTDSGLTTLATVEGLAQGLVADALAGLWKSKPNIRVSVTSVASARVPEMIDNGQAELGLSYLGSRHAYVNVLANVKLEIGVLLPQNHELASKGQISLEELAETGTPLLLSDQSVNVREMLEAAVGRSSLERHTRLVSNSTASLTRLAELGAGAAIRTRLEPILGRPDKGGLSFATLVELKGTVQELALIKNKDVSLSPAGQTVVEHLQRSLRELDT
ncbi:LysR family transcriptional regulator [Roseibaca sp. V10]|uniref:LysR family transcriptional regulator n=1 Tax=Roseinatronobacter domitianus TaxID=2940293 RepID=A0ABT0M4Y4_9RHOB|nr:LysR family transcriptional regulator [Roseibaca domitiana]MCL1629922.1 LysR family transcriptional regulator [Roseibaca domitiana]